MCVYIYIYTYIHIYIYMDFLRQALVSKAEVSSCLLRAVSGLCLRCCFPFSISQPRCRFPAGQAGNGDLWLRRPQRLLGLAGQRQSGQSGGDAAGRSVVGRRCEALGSRIPCFLSLSWCERFRPPWPWEVLQEQLFASDLV